MKVEESCSRFLERSEGSSGGQLLMAELFLALLLLGCNPPELGSVSPKGGSPGVCVLSLFNTNTGVAVYGRYDHLGQVGTAESTDLGTNHVVEIRFIGFQSNEYNMKYSRRVMVNGVTNYFFTTNFCVVVGMTNTNCFMDGTIVFSRTE